jgi:BASS family bile acid:Na+ symporter
LALRFRVHYLSQKIDPVDLVAVTKLLTSAGLIATMLAIGLRVRWGEVLMAAKQVQLVTLALIANFLLVPAATLGLLWLFDPEPMIGVGFLILAVCPGAPVGPLFAGIAKSDVPSAIGLMVILAGLSAILSPLFLAVLLGRFGPQNDLHVNYSAIVQTLIVTQILPLAIGLGTHERAPHLAAWIVKPLNVVANLLLLVVVVLLLATQFETLHSIGVRGWVGMLLLLAASLGIGWICGGPRQAARATLALTTTARNAAVGLVIVATSFAGTAAATAVVAYALVSTFGALGCALIYGAWTKPAR